MQSVVPGYDGTAKLLEGATSLARDEDQVVRFGPTDGGRDSSVAVRFFEGSATQTCLEVSQDGGHRHMTWIVAGKDYFVSRCGRRPQGSSLFRG
jgi:hypothetical protein